MRNTCASEPSFALQLGAARVLLAGLFRLRRR
jgi:hypothetical protein